MNARTHCIHSTKQADRYPEPQAVANLYNEHHRKYKRSKYTWENVCIVPGGRAGLIRIAAVLGNAYLGFL
jgi:hypothetical protein